MAKRILLFSIQKKREPFIAYELERQQLKEKILNLINIKKGERKNDS